MRPALRPGLLPVWRDRDTVQIGVDSRRAVALTGIGSAAAVIRLLDGSRDRCQLVAEADRQGVAAAVTERILATLAAAGVLVDLSAVSRQAIPAQLRDELTAELAAASMTRQDSDGGAQLLARRAATAVRVVGAGRVADAIGRLLTSAGLGTLAAPAGRPQAAASAPDLAVLVGRPEHAQAEALRRGGVPHLAVSANEAIGIVGPLVRPGVTACLRCLDMTRAERDPAWPLILAQVSGRDAEPQACDAALAAAVAAQAAAQAIAFADRAPLAEATANGTLELVLPAWQWRRRTWLPHRACSCGASR
jgi:bacteriocin biosynthesis cyclodehydratase domain-containing protein